MARQDLLALTSDDLVTLTNRGIVKRATQEAEAGEITVDFTEDDGGTVTARWSDDAECIFPGSETLSAARCSCPATTLCRHIIRTVFAYQQWAAQQEKANGETSEPAQALHTEPWDPGTIPDAVLEQYMTKQALTRARKQFDEGHLLELVRAAKPSARDHTLGFSIRFLVPNDPRYTYCDCGETAPCSHAAVAIWAFRQLAPDKAAGLISTRPTAYPVPSELLAQINTLLIELALDGIANAAASLFDRARRFEQMCRTENLAWPADILGEIVDQRQAYASHDARFDPAHVSDLIAELAIRIDAIGAATSAAPQLFIRGSKSDTLSDTGAARLIGLGCSVVLTRNAVNLSSFMQDTDGGLLLAVRRTFPDPPESSTDEPKPLWSLANAPVFKGASIGSLAAGQMLVKGGKRSPNHEFSFGRAPVSLAPQAFRWESLRAPLLAEDFGEIAARLSALPPAALRPRRLGENLHVCPVVEVEEAYFNTAEQAVIAVLRDAGGGTAILRHPYNSRSKEGTEQLLAALEGASAGRPVKFVAGEMRLGRGGLTVAPISLIVEADGARSMIQPWLSRYTDSGAKKQPDFEARQTAAHAITPETFCAGALTSAVQEAMLMGLGRAGTLEIKIWSDLRHTAGGLGFARLLDPIDRIIAGIEHKQSTLTWDGKAAAEALLELSTAAMLLRSL